MNRGYGMDYESLMCRPVGATHGDGAEATSTTTVAMTNQ
jgi:hypothetical protein